MIRMMGARQEKLEEKKQGERDEVMDDVHVTGVCSTEVGLTVFTNLEKWVTY